MDGLPSNKQYADNTVVQIQDQIASDDNLTAVQNDNGELRVKPTDCTDGGWR